MSPPYTRPHAWPYWLSLTFVPLLVLAMVKGGWVILLVPAYGWVLMPLLDLALGKDMRNADPDTPVASLFWFRLLTWIWFPIEVVLVFGALWVLTHVDGYTTIETLGIMFAIGVTTGIVGIVYAHELMHRAGRFERNLADLLMALVLYGHFRTEHLLVHHPYVATPRDTVTARYNMGFHRAFTRALLKGPGSAWRAEKAMLARRGRTVWHLSNPIWKYILLAMAFLILAFWIGGWVAIGLFALQAFVAVWQLELTNYVEHYGLTRKHLGEGRYEPVRPHHSWDSAQIVSGHLLINLQRHSDHHVHPMRHFPLLQIHQGQQAPLLPTGYPPMTALAMFPPLWRRIYNKKVRAWREQYYPEVTDWTPYKTGTLPNPVGAS